MTDLFFQENEHVQRHGKEVIPLIAVESDATMTSIQFSVQFRKNQWQPHSFS